MTEHERRKEKRKQDRLERLGSNEPACLLCGERDPACLERHHLAGRTFGSWDIIVCRNCHRKLSDRQKDHPPVLRSTPNSLESHGRLLLGMADALDLLETPPALTALLRQSGLHLIDYGQAFRPDDGDDQ